MVSSSYVGIFPVTNDPLIYIPLSQVRKQSLLNSHNVGEIECWLGSFWEARGLEVGGRWDAPETAAHGHTQGPVGVLGRRGVVNARKNLLEISHHYFLSLFDNLVMQNALCLLELIYKPTYQTFFCLR